MKQRVLIVGGGLAGSSIAWHLSKDSEVQVFDAGKRLGNESSRQNAGMLRRLGEDPYERRLAERSHRFLSSPPEDWDGLCPAAKTGALMLLSQDPHHLEHPPRGPACHQVRLPQKAIVLSSSFLIISKDLETPIFPRAPNP